MFEAEKSQDPGHHVLCNEQENHDAHEAGEEACVSEHIGHKIVSGLLADKVVLYEEGLFGFCFMWAVVVI